MSWSRVARPWAARLPGAACCSVMELIFTCCYSLRRTYGHWIYRRARNIDRPMVGMFLIDRQSVCYLEDPMDVSTFTAHRRTLGTPGGEIAYTELGAGPVALFVHGLGTNGVLGRHFIENLRDTSRCIAIDLPLHGGTPGRDDLSVTALAQVVAELCDGLGLTQVDLVGNDTGGAVAQLFAARRPDRIRSLVLTNCDCEGNFPPPEFAPVVAAARQGQLADLLTTLAADREAWRQSPA